MTEIEKEGTVERPFYKHLISALPDTKSQVIFWSLAVSGLAADLWTKKAVFDWLEHSGSYRVLDGFLQIVTAVNNGAAFGILAGQLHLLRTIPIVALIVIISIFYFSGNRQRLVHIAMGLFTAGICGNLYDRIFYDGLVRDFIDVHFRNYHWPAFNVADSLLCIGVGLLIVSTFFTPQSDQKHDQQHK